MNKCGVISPRFDIKLKNFEKFMYQILPSRQFGHVILTTNKGIMDHHEARKNHIGGKVLGFFYWFIYCTMNNHILIQFDINLVNFLQKNEYSDDILHYF